MTPAEFAEQIAEVVAEWRDPEESHCRTDELMMEVLVELGYGEGVELLANETRWYA